jgi:hypothetical protein
VHLVFFSAYFQTSLNIFYGLLYIYKILILILFVAYIYAIINMCEIDTRGGDGIQHYHILHIRGKDDQRLVDETVILVDHKIESPFHFGQYEITYTTLRSTEISTAETQVLFIRTMIHLCHKRHVLLVLDTFADNAVFEYFINALRIYDGVGVPFKNVSILNIQSLEVGFSELHSSISVSRKIYKANDDSIKFTDAADDKEDVNLKTYVFRKIIDVFPSASRANDRQWPAGEVFKRYGNRLVAVAPSALLRPLTTVPTDIPRDAWWFRYLFSVPSCAHFRLTQSTGTCWLNAALNMILFTPVVANLIALEISSLVDQKLRKFVHNFKEEEKTAAFADMIFTLFYRIFCQKEKIRSQENFLSVVARRIKLILRPVLVASGCNIERYDDDYNRDGFSDCTGDVVQLILEQGINLAKISRESSYPFAKLSRLSGDAAKIDQILLNAELAADFEFSDLDALIERQPPFIVVSPHAMVEIPTTRTPPTLTTYALLFKFLPREIKKEHISYDLVSATLSIVISIFDDEETTVSSSDKPLFTHFVCGYRCGKEGWFVYDSNGYSISGDWQSEPERVLELLGYEYDDGNDFFFEKGLVDKETDTTPPRSSISFLGYRNAMYVPRTAQQIL